MNNRRGILSGLALLPLLGGATLAAAKTHRLALQISDDGAEKMNAVLNVAANVSRDYAEQGDVVEIQIVAFNAGLHMLRADTSPVKERVVGFRKSMPNVDFKACQNTMASMAKRDGHAIELLPGVDTVAAGVTHLIELAETGWVIVRP